MGNNCSTTKHSVAKNDDPNLRGAKSQDTTTTTTTTTTTSTQQYSNGQPTQGQPVAAQRPAAPSSQKVATAVPGTIRPPSQIQDPGSAYTREKQARGDINNTPKANTFANMKQNLKPTATKGNKPVKRFASAKDAADNNKENQDQPGYLNHNNVEIPDEDPYATVSPSKYVLKEIRTNGGFSYMSLGKQQEVKGTIQHGIDTFKNNPNKYIAMTYQASMKDWTPERQQYTLYHREGTEKFEPVNISPNGWMSVLVLEYQHLPPFPNNEFPMEHRDKYTDKMVHKGRLCHSPSNKPICPGRGMGCGDTPLLKIIGDIDPSDIYQGSVGDCWLLSAISAIAEFDGAVKKLYRKTSNLYARPLPGPNVYTITLWDLSTWKEVDIVIDERLPAGPDGRLMASKPSEDGELWACYLEKALSIHCGGWDNITGGQCTHAWAMMTGCKEQYTIMKDATSGRFACFSRFNPNINDWDRHDNNPKIGIASPIYKCAWPRVGGGGDRDITEDELFMKMYAFDQQNYIVGAAVSKNTNKFKKKADAGLVENHAYTVIEAVHNAAGTGIDLLKIRNPWGKGEIEDGEFDDDGPGWQKYPQIKALLNPVVADDGIFWVTKQEFFKFYDTIYVSASDMTQFLED